MEILERVLGRYFIFPSWCLWRWWFAWWWFAWWWFAWWWFAWWCDDDFVRFAWWWFAWWWCAWWWWYIYIWYIVCDGVFHCFFPSQKGCPNVLPRGQHWDAERLYSVGLSTVASRGWGHRRQRSLCRNECAKCSWSWWSWWSVSMYGVMEMWSVQICTVMTNISRFWILLLPEYSTTI